MPGRISALLIVEPAFGVGWSEEFSPLLGLLPLILFSSLYID